MKTYFISSKKKEVEDTYIYTLSPKNPTDEILFKPGQYVFLQNPAFVLPDEQHPFSIASSPTEKRFLEFCIKAYGDWTENLTTMEISAPLFVSDPMGKFVWDNHITNAAFLLGGIGISPIMSMLRYLREINNNPQITLLYGNRTPETIAYNAELEDLKHHFKKFKRVDIFSHLPKNHPWNGYKGFITPEIIKQEIDLSSSPTLFIIGPPIFIQKMKKIFSDLHIAKTFIKEELLEEK